jgi:hypothetical protein
MKYIVTLIILLTLLSCGNRVEKVVEGNQLTFSMDTVVVNAIKLRKKWPLELK